MSRIPDGVDPTQWLIEQIQQRHIPHAITRLVVAGVAVVTVKNRTVQVLMGVAAVADAVTLVWLRRRVQELARR